LRSGAINWHDTDARTDHFFTQRNRRSNEFRHCGIELSRLIVERFVTGLIQPDKLRDGAFNASKYPKLVSGGNTMIAPSEKEELGRLQSGSQLHQIPRRNLYCTRRRHHVKKGEYWNRVMTDTAPVIYQ
jgi:hypothetical protein